MRFKEFLFEGAYEVNFLKRWVYTGLGNPEQRVSQDIELTKQSVIKGILGMYRKACSSDSGGLKYVVEEMMSCARKLKLDSPEEFATIEKHMDDAIAASRQR